MAGERQEGAPHSAWQLHGHNKDASDWGCHSGLLCGAAWLVLGHTP